MLRVQDHRHRAFRGSDIKRDGTYRFVNGDVPRDEVEDTESSFLDLIPKCDAFVAAERCDEHVVVVVSDCP